MSIVARSLDARQDLIAELGICAYTLLLLRHTYMCLIDKQIANLRCAEVIVFPVEGLLSDKLSCIVLRTIVLHHPLSAGGDTVTPALLSVEL